MIGLNMRVNHRCLHTLMAKQALDSPNISTRSQQMTDKAVSQCVWANILLVLLYFFSLKTLTEEVLKYQQRVSYV